MFFGMADLEVLLTVRKALQSEVLHTEPSTQIPSRRGMTDTLCSMRNPLKREVAFLETSDKRKTIQRPARTDHTTRNLAECLIINALANYIH